MNEEASESAEVPGIYAITHIATGKRYIGSSQNIRRRWYEHRWRLDHGVHHSRYLQRCWNKYGADAFTFAVVEIVENLDELITREQWHLDDRWARHQSHELNASPTALGTRGYRFTPEQRAAQSARRKGKPWSASMRAAWPGTTPRMRAANEARRGRPPTFAQLMAWERRRQLGPTERQRAAMAAMRGRPASPEQRANLAKGWLASFPFVMTECRRAYYNRRRGMRANPAQLHALLAGRAGPGSPGRMKELQELSAAKRRGVPLTPEHRARISAGNHRRMYRESDLRGLRWVADQRRGKPMAENHRQALKDAWVRRKQKPMSDKQRLAYEAMRGRDMTPEIAAGLDAGRQAQIARRREAVQRVFTFLENWPFSERPHLEQSDIASALDMTVTAVGTYTRLLKREGRIDRRYRPIRQDASLSQFSLFD